MIRRYYRVNKYGQPAPDHGIIYDPREHQKTVYAPHLQKVELLSMILNQMFDNSNTIFTPVIKITDQDTYFSIFNDRAWIQIQWTAKDLLAIKHKRFGMKTWKIVNFRNINALLRQIPFCRRECDWQEEVSGTYRLAGWLFYP